MTYVRAILLAYAGVALAAPPAITDLRPAVTEYPPLRDLDFGDINFLHTTDTHGWHAGHLLEPSYNANWGDYVSFSERLRAQLEGQGRDLLVVDTGDRIEGNGLYDASNPRGKYTFGIFEQQKIDLLCIGNHELYKNTSAEDDYSKLVPSYKENYIASNLKIVDHETGQLELFAQTHREFTTKSGIRIMAFGFIFDFTRNDKNTVITPVEVAVKEPWFQAALKDTAIDLIVVIGHVALRAKEFEIIHREIRSVNSTVPIQFFGGHYHIRDYRIFDHRAHALASGRFMETIGFQSISGLRSDNVTFARRYIDNNLYSLHHHSNTTKDTFSTSSGLVTTENIVEARSSLKLDDTFGCAPRTYWMSQVPYDDPSSVFELLTKEVFPSLTNPSRVNRSRMIMSNTGAIRFDIFAGPFTRDSTFIVSPFTSNLSYIPDVPYRLAKQLLPILNLGPPAVISLWRELHYAQRNKLHFDDLASPEEQGRRRLTAVSGIPTSYTAGSQSQDSGNKQTPLTSPSAHLLPGYTTHDDLGSDGDDTIHSPIPAYAVPNCIQAILPASSSSISGRTSNSSATTHLSFLSDTSSDDEPIDLIFNEFLTPYILKLLNFLPYLDPLYTGDYRHDHVEWQRNAAWSITRREWCDDGVDIEHVELGIYEGLEPPERSRFALSAMVAEDNGDGIIEGTNRNDENISKARIERPTWTQDDVQNYLEGETFTSLLAKWVSQNWAENCKTAGMLEEQREL